MGLSRWLCGTLVFVAETGSTIRKACAENMVVLVGLTGALGSGKGTIAEILSRLAAEHGLRVLHFSISDEIRRDLELRGIAHERHALKKTADTLRYRAGSSAWAMLVASRIEELLAGIEEPVLVIVDSIRNPAEIDELRSRYGNRFKMIGVTAPLGIIHENLRSRNRDDESSHLLEDQVVLGGVMRSEMGSGEPSFGHNVAACLEMADWPPIANDGSLHELEEDIVSLTEKYIFPLYHSPPGIPRSSTGHA